MYTARNLFLKDIISNLSTVCWSFVQFSLFVFHWMLRQSFECSFTVTFFFRTICEAKFFAFNSFCCDNKLDMMIQ